MKLIDSHCHLYSTQFDTDKQDMFERAYDAGIQKFLFPAIDMGYFDAMIQTAKDYQGCHCMMGVHPCSITENYKEELAFAKKKLDEGGFIAVGEIGIDLYWSTDFEAQQLEAFNTQMQWALDKNLPISIHSRNAMQQTIAAVKPFAEKGLRGVFHCFSGNAADAKTITDMGFLLGIGGVITYKNSGLKEAIKDVDLKHIILETDAPYLAPVPYRSKRNEAGYLAIILAELASLKQMNPETVAEITSENCEQLFFSK